MNDVIEKENIEIESMIYEIRGIQVILDRDLAKLYKVETKVFMQSVKRNINKFPDNFMFQLTKDEFTNWRSQFVTSKNDLIGLRRPPYAFTEYGVAMLSGILRSKIAINTNIAIINAFVKMRHFIIENGDIYKSLNYINNKLIIQEDKINDNTNKINYIFNKFNPKEQLYLAGQIYDAFSDIIELFMQAKKDLIIIDSYADKTLLDIIRNIKCEITLITKENNKLNEIDVEKYNSQYHNLKVVRNNNIHDRYFIIDKLQVYHSGTSINNAGNKTFSINKLEDEFIISTLLKSVNEIINS